MSQLTDIDKALSLRMAILKLRCGEEDNARTAEITGRLVQDKVGYQLRSTGYPPNVVAQYANGEKHVSNEVFELLMKAFRCSLFCAARDH